MTFEVIPNAVTGPRQFRSFKNIATISKTNYAPGIWGAATLFVNPLSGRKSCARLSGED